MFRRALRPIRSTRGVVFFLFTTLAVVLTPGVPRVDVVAAEVRVPVDQRFLALGELRLQEQWPDLDLRSKRRLAPYLIENSHNSDLPADDRRKLPGILLNESDPFLKASGAVAAIFRRDLNSGKRIAYLTQLRKKGGLPAQLANFYIAVERGRLGQSVPAEQYAGACDLPDQQSLCTVARLKLAVDAAYSARSFSEQNLERILDAARPLLGRAPFRPPFYAPIAGDAPEKLYALGLPLEAAILAERMTYAAADDREQGIRARIPYYLAASGDFESAARFSAKISHTSDPALLNARLDWLILGGHYTMALNYIGKMGLDRLSTNAAKIAPANSREYWSGFPAASREEIQLRSAMLLYLAGDIKKAASALDRLTNIPGNTPAGEPARLYARLRQAQIVLEDNPELAHKIAEDITYIAQANEWYLLEYHATVLDGWAYVYLGKHYRGVINFIKARGILSADKREHAAEYSRLLGLLTARNRMNVRGNHSALIKQINTLLAKRPYNEAVYTIREWVHRGAGPDMFLLEAVRNYNLRGRRWDALNLLLEFSHTGESFFQPGNNPGGARGFLTSTLWSQELHKFGYMERTPAAELSLTAATRSGSRAQLPKTGERNLSTRSLDRNAYYVFHFDVQGGRYVYVLYPYKRTLGIDYVFLRPTELEAMKLNCTFAQPDGCAAYLSSFESVRKNLGSGKNRTLYVHYQPEFDGAFERVLFPNPAARPATVHFYDPSVHKNADRLAPNNLIAHPQGCSASLPLSSATASPGFEERFSGAQDAGGIWLWPLGLDAKHSRSGTPRPVYLRKFLCGKTRLRLWDMDRFGRAGRAPELVVYRRRTNEAALDRAFARFMAGQGTMLLEFDAKAAPAAQGFVGDVRGGGSVLRSFDAGAAKAGRAEGRLRLILPGIPG